MWKKQRTHFVLECRQCLESGQLDLRPPTSAERSFKHRRRLAAIRKRIFPVDDDRGHKVVIHRKEEGLFDGVLSFLVAELRATVMSPKP